MKLFISFILVLCVITILPFGVSAASYESYDGSSDGLSSTYVDYLSEALSDIDPNEHYVLFRSSQYSHVLAVGKELKYSNGSVTGHADVLILTASNTSSGYNSYNDYSVSYSDDSNFKYSYDGEMVYSDIIPGIPSLNQYRSESQYPMIYLTVGVIGVFALLFILFKRNDRGVTLKA